MSGQTSKIHLEIDLELESTEKYIWEWILDDLSLNLSKQINFKIIFIINRYKAKYYLYNNIYRYCRILKYVMCVISILKVVAHCEK